MLHVVCTTYYVVYEPVHIIQYDFIFNIIFQGDQSLNLILAPDMNVYKKEARQMVHGLEDRMMGVVGALGQKIQSMSNMLNGGYQPTSYRIAK